MTYQIVVRNEALQSGSYRGSYTTLAEAQDAAKAYVVKCRAFVTAQPCEYGGKTVGELCRGVS